MTSVVVLSPDELRALIREAVETALAEQREDAAVLLDRSGIARTLGVGTSTVDRFRKAGMPTLMVGDSPRFIVVDCVTWLKAQRAEAPTSG